MNSDSVIRVAVVDDQALVRVGLRTLLASEEDLLLVGDASDGREGLALIRRSQPDVVLCDIRMPDVDGLALLREVTADASLAEVRVVMLTTFELDDYVFEALRIVASGFLLKDTRPAQLLAGIRDAVDGGALLSPSVTRTVVAEFVSRAPTTRTPHPLLHLLTQREREVVALVAEGLSNEEIAGTLVVSPATARTHVSRAVTKLGARDRAQLVVFAYQSGLA